jgi:phosphate/sulfate permease
MRFLVSFSAGIISLAIHQLIARPALPESGEYFWSTLAAQNYVGWTCVLVSISALLIAYKMGGNPVAIGFGTVAIFPIITLVEATVYRGSHNLLPFELGMYVIFGLFPIVGALLGSFIRRYYRAARQDAAG